ncbi:MAG TPA: hypothetical protein VND62_05265 [Acidimicrobiales bacterium]|nr:hypothetical protein [Acidimicrobiales bacterium]
MPDANDMNELAAEAARRARDAAYVAVGLGVLGVQRARAARHDLARQDRVDEGVARLRAGIASGSQQLGAWLEGSRTFVTSQLAPIGAQLPQPARELADKALARLGELGAQLRQLGAPGA